MWHLLFFFLMKFFFFVPFIPSFVSRRRLRIEKPSSGDVAVLSAFTIDALQPPLLLCPASLHQPLHKAHNSPWHSWKRLFTALTLYLFFLYSIFSWFFFSRKTKTVQEIFCSTGKRPCFVSVCGVKAIRVDVLPFSPSASALSLGIKSFLACCSCQAVELY